ncbi:unnamed protein product [Darwinula stevensoni]|uniref:Uncharacterized protein n=1 Tax=Darwinula stevensoni TaxID=69355 RepID=A0A7R8XCL8_9CRUS|nr:unnamed protein product [Darwinula stevensoni]CAG0893894.1 unnamed protein product [Darwinula stevensoni]
MKPLLLLLTPQQRDLVNRSSPVILLSGASGTGKTIVLKRRAIELAEKDEVLVINIAGGLLTEEFRRDFEGKKKIHVVNEKGEDLEADIDKLKKFLEVKGEGKHVLMDEVPITLGFHGVLSPEALSEHWEWIVGSLKTHVLSVTLAFRPNDQSYSRDFNLQDVKPAGSCGIVVLNSVKRNTRYVSELFLAVGSFARRVFLSSQPSLKLDLEASKTQSLPRLFTIPSCQAFHRECKDVIACRSLRASHALQAIHEEMSKSSTEKLVYVVVEERMRMALVDILTLLCPSIPVLYYDSIKDEPLGEFKDSKVSFLVFTEMEVQGCHQENVTVVLDFPQIQWINYFRLIAVSGDNKIIVIEEEELSTGRFSRLVNDIPGWKLQKVKIDESDFSRRLAIASERHNEKKAKRNSWRVEARDPSWLGRDPLAITDNFHSGQEEDEEEIDSARMITVIFGYPASGKSRKVNRLIRGVIDRRGRVLLLHCGSKLSSALCRKRWEAEGNVEIGAKPKTLEGILDEIDFKIRQNDEDGSTNENEQENILDPLVVVVEDFMLSRELEKDMKVAIERLKTMNVKVIITFKPHSVEAQDTSVERIIKEWQQNQDLTVIALRSQPTNTQLLKHIQRNETPTALNLESRSLCTSATSISIVFGHPVQYLNHCSGHHRGYACKGRNSCGNNVPVLSSLSQFILSGETGDKPYVLVSDEALLAALQKSSSISAMHPRDFRGCEASFVISVNVGDDWLLEVISRSRTHLIIIDSIPEHEDLWKTMLEENRVRAWDVPFPKEFEDDSKTLLQLDDEWKFLFGPTWNEGGRRMGEEAVKIEGILDEHKGCISSLSPDMWRFLNENDLFPLPKSRAPFATWGFVASDWKGEVPVTDDKTEIQENLRLRGVEWENADYPPFPMETKTKDSRAGGVLESLSVYLTGSLLHLSLLRKILGNESGSIHSLLQSASDHLWRPIVLIAENLSSSRSFFPRREGKGTTNEEWKGGVLFFARDTVQSIQTLPVVPYQKSGNVWLTVEKLPPVHEDGWVPPSLKRVSFRGEVNVFYKLHTVPIMWALDRHLAGLQPLNLGMRSSAFSSSPYTIFCH